MSEVLSVARGKAGEIALEAGSVDVGIGFESAKCYRMSRRREIQEAAIYWETSQAHVRFGVPVGPSLIPRDIYKPRGLAWLPPGILPQMVESPAQKSSRKRRSRYFGMSCFRS